jgi:translocation and assembly module TamB
LPDRCARPAAGPFTGQLTAKGSGLGALLRLDAKGRYQEVLVNLRANDTVLPGKANLGIGAAIVDARIVLYDKPWVVADAQLGDTRINKLNIREARVLVDYRDGHGQGGAVRPRLYWRCRSASLQRRARAEAVASDGPGQVRGRHVQDHTPARIIPAPRTTSCCRRGSISARAMSA